MIRCAENGGRSGLGWRLDQLTDKGLALEIAPKSTKYHKDDDLN